MTMPKHWYVPLLAAFLNLPAAGTLYANCEVPTYQIGKVYPSSAETKDSTVADIAIRQGDFTIDKLVCLAPALKERFLSKVIIVRMFSSLDAAKNFRYHPPEAIANDSLWASQQHASYYYDEGQHAEWVMLMPNGIDDSETSPFSTRIDLPVAKRPVCKLQIQDRCVTAFDHIYSSNVPGSGTVTLAAQIEPTGSVSGIRIVHRGTSEDKKARADFALKNLKSWRFEPAQKKTKIQITYSIEPVLTPFEHGINVQFFLPDKVNIQVNRVEKPN
jgi:hypothetical protein